MAEPPQRHVFVRRLHDGQLSFRELAHFAGQYHHVVSERHAAECIALRRVPLRANGLERNLGGGNLARLWLQFTFAVGGVPSAHPGQATRGCVRALRELSHASIESAIGVVTAIDRVDAAMADRFCGHELPAVYQLRTLAALEYFEQHRARRELWLEAVGTAARHPDALAAEAAASRALGRFLDALAIGPRLRAAS